MTRSKKAYNKAKQRKQYKLIHLPTAEQVFGVHSRGWWNDRLKHNDITCQVGPPVGTNHWQFIKKGYVRVCSIVYTCQSCEFELVECGK